MSTLDRPNLLVLVRHGESLRNLAKKQKMYLSDDESASLVKRIADHDIPLTSRGELQAEITGPFLRESFGVFDVVYHSGYKRAYDTKPGAA